MNKFFEFYYSSVGKKQIVAATGLFLILFVIAHLAGNLFIYGGPSVFNGYAEKLAHLRPGLYLLEFGLLLIFLIHLFVTAQLVWENWQARPQRYATYKPSEERSLSAKLMSYTGTLIFAFVVWHILDFTFADHVGPRSILSDGLSYGLYGIVINSFSNPTHSALYILAMIAVGMHLSHGIQSFFQTFGVNHPRYTIAIRKTSNFLGTLIAIGYSTIPIYVLINNFRG